MLGHKEEEAATYMMFDEEIDLITENQSQLRKKQLH